MALFGMFLCLGGIFGAAECRIGFQPLAITGVLMLAFISAMSLQCLFCRLKISYYNPFTGLVARTKALMNLPSNSFAISSTSRPLFDRKTRASSIL